MELFDLCVVVFAIFGFIHFATYCVVDCLDFIKLVIKKQESKKTKEN